MKKYLIIEIGTNTTKVLCGILQNSHWDIISDELYPSRIGSDIVNKGNISSEAMDRSLQVIEQVVKAFAPNHDFIAHVIATESLRSAANAETFTDKVRKQFGLDVEILIGEEEARLAYLSATSQATQDKVMTAVLDIGGGSTELTIGQAGEMLYAKSLSLGAVKMTDKFIKHDPALDSELQELTVFLENQLSEFKHEHKIKSLIGVGGTITTLAMLHQSEQKALNLPSHETISLVENTPLTLTQISGFVKLLSTLTISEKRILPGMPEGRADIILTGTVILNSVMQYLRTQNLVVSTKGVRHGYLLAHCH